MPILRLFIPACLFLVTVGATTTIGPEAPWPIEAIATSTHAKNKASKARRKRPSSAAARIATTGAAPDADHNKVEPGSKVEPNTEAKAQTKIEPISFAERFAPFAAAVKTPHPLAAKPPEATAFAAAAPSDVPANPLAAEPTPGITIPMSPPPGTPAAVRKRVVYRSQREICDTLAKAAHSNNLPVPFFIRLLFQESRFDAASVSHAGAQGIAQFMPETAHDVGLANPFDPLQAIPAAARLLRDFIDQFGNLGLAAAAYNAGPTRVHKWLKKQSALPKETRGYVETITGKTADSWKSAPAEHSDAGLPEKAPCKVVPARYRVATATRVPVPLPPEPPESASATVMAPATRKTPAKHRKTVAAAKPHTRAHATPRDETALQLAARRRGKKGLD